MLERTQFRLTTLVTASSALALAVALGGCRPHPDHDVDTTQITGAVVISSAGPNASPPASPPRDGVSSLSATPAEMTPAPEEQPGGVPDPQSQPPQYDPEHGTVSDVGMPYPMPTAPDRPSNTPTVVTTTSSQAVPASTFPESSFGPPPPARALDESSFGPDAGLSPLP